MATPIRPNAQQLKGMSRREFMRVSGFVALAGGTWALSGCGLSNGDGEPDDSPDGGSKTLRMTSVPIDSLDPHVITNGVWFLSRGVLEGLVVQNDEGTDVVAATAEDWGVSDDGLTYTFHVRADATWSNGDQVSAHDFERSYQRLLAPRGGGSATTAVGQSSYQASTGIKGAQEFMSGAIDSWEEVGIRATSDEELVLTLEAPNPDFLLALTHPSMLPLHMDSVESKPDNWQTPPDYVSNGAYVVEQYVANSSMKLVPNEHYWDRSSVSLDLIEVLQVDAGASAGTLTVPYENDETDILQISDADVLRFQESTELSEHLHAVDTYSVAYLARLRSQHPAMDDVRVRRAFSLALDRETLAGVIPGARPGVSLVHDKVPGWDESLALEGDLDEAKRLLEAAGYPEGRGLPPVRILAGSDSPVIEAVIDQWKNRLGVEARNDRVEVGVYAERRWQVQEADYIGFYWGTFAGLPTLPTYVGTLWRPTDIQKFSMPSAAWQEYLTLEADQSMDAKAKNAALEDLLGAHASEDANRLRALEGQAKVELDEAKRRQKYLDAARLRENEYVFLPLLWLSAFFAVRPSVSGLKMRRYPDFFYLKSLGIEG